MKNTILKFSLTALSALTLAACGSSGGGDAGSSSQAPTKDKQAAQTTQPAKKQNNSSNPVSTSSNNKTGGAIVVDSDNKGHVTAKTINGMKLNGKLEVCCGSYSNVRFGAIESQDPSQDDILFYNGYPTTSMPSSGVASYRGDSIISADTDKLPDEDYLKGSSSFTADFGNKKLTGTLSTHNKDVVKIDANISGNGFSGTAKSDLLNSQGKAEGKFYGENAKELGGSANANDNSWGAAFAAKK